MGVRAVLTHGGAPAPLQQPPAAAATALLPLACCTPPRSTPLTLLARACLAGRASLLLLLCRCSCSAHAPLHRELLRPRPARATTSRLTRAVACAREHRAAAAGPAHARPCAPHPCTVPLVPLRAPAPPSPRASTARAPPQASTAGLASSRGAREEGGFQRRVRGEERREEKRQRGEGRADRWAPPPCGVHVTKNTTKTTPMAKYDRF